MAVININRRIKMKKTRLSLAILLVLTTASAYAHQKEYFAGWNFFAPDVADEQQLNSVLNPGDIVYDTGENKFYGKTGSGNSWVEFGSGTAAKVVTSSTAVWGHESAKINCSSTSSVSQSSGTWVTAGNRSGRSCTLTWSGTPFSSAPNCVASLATDQGANATTVNIFSTTTTGATLSCKTQAGATTSDCLDYNAFIICHGPR
jgi:hypothetical protein